MAFNALSNSASLKLCSFQSTVKKIQIEPIKSTTEQLVISRVMWLKATVLILDAKPGGVE